MNSTALTERGWYVQDCGYLIHIRQYSEEILGNNYSGDDGNPPIGEAQGE